MQKFPLKLDKSLQLRKQQNAFRQLGSQGGLIDFSSNDYLGFAESAYIFRSAINILKDHDLKKNGSTGSRLLSGNHILYGLTEEEIKNFFNSETALIYNSGYDANLGFFSSIPQRGDVIFYDELSHASIRDGINISNARAYKFSHNDHENLENRINRIQNSSFDGEIYIVTEAVFSMDGDIPDLKAITAISEKYSCYLIVDEAHSTGVLGKTGKGLVSDLGIEDRVFARLITFGKALGSHGAVILGSNDLKNYLVNFSRSLIYTTALPPHSVATILAAVRHLQLEGKKEMENLQKNIAFFNSEVKKRGMENCFISGTTAIRCCLLPGNDRVKQAAASLQNEKFDVKPILSPTVPEGKERLRFCLHSFNTKAEMENVLSILQDLIE